MTDTKMSIIEKKYGKDYGVKSDQKLGNYLKKKDTFIKIDGFSVILVTAFVYCYYNKNGIKICYEKTKKSIFYTQPRPR